MAEETMIIWMGQYLYWPVLGVSKILIPTYLRLSCCLVPRLKISPYKHGIYQSSILPVPCGCFRNTEGLPRPATPHQSLPLLPAGSCSQVQPRNYLNALFMELFISFSPAILIVLLYKLSSIFIIVATLSVIYNDSKLLSSLPLCYFHY